MRYSGVDCCEIDKHSSGLLLSRKVIFHILRQQVDLIYGLPSMSKARLHLREKWIDEWLDTSVDEPLEDHEVDIQ